MGSVNKYDKVVKLFGFLILILFYTGSKAQVPEKIHFQVTVKDHNDILLADKVLGSRISIVSQSSDIYYTEEQIVSTNSRGMASIVVGNGTNIVGDIGTIPWNKDGVIFYVRSMFDPSGGTDYSIITNNRIGSVPYALLAKGVAVLDEKDPVFNNSVAGSISKDNISRWNRAVRERHYPGDFVGGGIVFNVDSTGERGLVASLHDIADEVVWMPDHSYLSDSDSYYQGLENSNSIVQHLGVGDYAAYYCDTLTLNGYNDWYLPSIGELSLLFDSRYQVNKALGEDNNDLTSGLWSDRYWSSTQKNTDNAYLFTNGNAFQNRKETLANVRAIRSFSGLYDVKNYEWAYLGGPEAESGEPVNLLEYTEGDLILDVSKKRGVVFRPIPETRIPFKVSFNLQTEYDPNASEPPTILRGTADFRISVAGPKKGEPAEAMQESNLGDFEGVQFRIHPHMDECPIRVYTSYPDGTQESHTSTSIWIRYADPSRITGSGGEPHTGFQSDACQNRNKPPTHNCGWSRVALLENGFGLANREETKVTIIISELEISIEANNRVFSVNIEADYDLRFDRVTNFVLSHHNTSRGYQSIRITDLRVFPMARRNEIVLLSRNSTNRDIGYPCIILRPGEPLTLTEKITFKK